MRLGTARLSSVFLCLLYALIAPACFDPRTQAEKSMAKARHLKQEAEKSEGEERTKALSAALDELRRAVEKDPSFLEARLDYARGLWDSGRQIEAVRETEALMDERPDDPQVFELAGDIFLMIQQVKRALDAYRKAIDLSADPRDLHLKLGTAAGKCGQFETAFEAFDLAMEAGAPKDVVYYNLGICYLGTKQWEVALENLEKSLESNPAYLPSLKQFVVLYVRGDLSEALPAATARSYALKAYELNPTDIKVISNLADIYMVSKEYESALGLVEKALALYPDEESLIKFKSGLEQLIGTKEGGEEIGEN